MSVKFCPLCCNIFGHKIDDETLKLIPVCLTCGFTETKVDHCLVVNELNNRVQDYPLSHNTPFDCTMPRTRKIPCPNPECPYNKKKSKSETKGESTKNIFDNPEVVIFQYNPTMLKSGYMCIECKTYWKN